MDRSHAVVIHQNGSHLPAHRPEAIPVVVTPVTDLYEAEREYVVHLDVPGATRDTIRVEVRPGMMHVTGDVVGTSVAGHSIRHREIVWNRFTRSFNLGPGIHAEGITAAIADGVLTVRIPKAEDVLPRNIPVQ